ncbi:hypothetical protein Tco_0982504 [Tanacetum coccineum]
MAECSNCKFLAERIKTLEARISVLEGQLEMERHPENHTLESAGILHEIYQGMRNLNMEMAENNSVHLEAGGRNKILEARVYRRWIARNIPTPTPIGYCCILLDRQFTMWDDMAHEFDKTLVEKMEAPMIIVVSSCRVSIYSCRLHRPRTTTFIWTSQSLSNLEMIQKYRQWLSLSFRRYSGLLMVSGCQECVDHGPQPEPTYRFSFKAFVLDETVTTLFTFFTPIVDAFTRHECPELVRKLGIPNPQQIPPEVLAIEGRKHTFQFHFKTSNKIRAVDFTLDDVLYELVGIGASIEPTKIRHMSTPG